MNKYDIELNRQKELRVRFNATKTEFDNNVTPNIVDNKTFFNINLNLLLLFILLFQFISLI